MWGYQKEFLANPLQTAHFKLMGHWSPKAWEPSGLTIIVYDWILSFGICSWYPSLVSFSFLIKYRFYPHHYCTAHCYTLHIIFFSNWWVVGAYKPLVPVGGYLKEFLENPLHTTCLAINTAWKIVNYICLMASKL